MIVDAHHHFWNLEREAAALDDGRARRRSGARSSPPTSSRCSTRAGVGATVLVQAACSDVDTDSMFEHAGAARLDRRRDRLVDLALARAGARAPRRARAPSRSSAGFRHLIHDEPDPHWILQDDVLESLALLEERRLILELPCVFPRHLGDVPELAASLPRADDRDRPPRQAAARHRRDGRAGRERSERRPRTPTWPPRSPGSTPMLPRATGTPPTCARRSPSPSTRFGPDRLVCGSDWPVALLNGSYEQVWRETRARRRRRRAGRRRAAPRGNRAAPLRPRPVAAPRRSEATS